MLEQMKGIEPSSQPWQGRIITSILHLHGISGTEAGPVPPKCDLCQRVEPVDELESPTFSLQVRCTANCATPAFIQISI